MTDAAFREVQILTILERRRGASPGVPEGDDLHLVQACGQAVVHVVVDPREVNAAHAARPATRCRGAAAWLVSDEGQRAGEIVAQGIGRRRPVDLPPVGGGFHLTRRA